MAEPRYQDLNAFQMPRGFRGRSAIVVQVWWIVQATLFAWSPQFMFGWRAFLLRAFGAKVGRGLRIRSSARVTYPWKLAVGDHVWIGDESVLYNLGEIRIGNNVAIAHRVCLCTGSHQTDRMSFDIIENPISIGDEVWLANDVFVAPGVAIGRGCVVGARSTVLSDLPTAMVCVGNPCKPMRPRVTLPE